METNLITKELKLRKVREIEERVWDKGYYAMKEISIDDRSESITKYLNLIDDLTNKVIDLISLCHYLNVDSVKFLLKLRGVYYLPFNYECKIGTHFLYRSKMFDDLKSKLEENDIEIDMVKGRFMIDEPYYDETFYEYNIKNISALSEVMSIDRGERVYNSYISEAHKLHEHLLPKIADMVEGKQKLLELELVEKDYKSNYFVNIFAYTILKDMLQKEDIILNDTATYKEEVEYYHTLEDRNKNFLIRMFKKRKKLEYTRVYYQVSLLKNI